LVLWKEFNKGKTAREAVILFNPGGVLMSSIKLAIYFAVLLLVPFWFNNLFGAEYFPRNLDMPAGDKGRFEWLSSKVLEEMKESPLWQKVKSPNAISYRFTYIPAKGGEPVVLRLDRITKGKWILTIKQADYSSESEFKVNRKRPLTRGEINQFQELFSRLKFSELPTVGALEAEDVMDGSTWILEAVENGRYHMIRRISPTGGIWITVPDEIKGFEKLRREQGYPYIDRATSETVNKRLVAVGEFLLNLSDLNIRVY
jgi:hypothetical protein